MLSTKIVFAQIRDFNTSPAEYCRAYQMTDLTEKDDSIHRSCIENKSIDITKGDLNELTGFLKAGSHTSYTYLARTGKARFKGAIRKLVLQRLMQKRIDYLGLYNGNTSEFEKIASCAKEHGVEEYNKNNIKMSAKKKRDIFARSHVEASFILNAYLSYNYNLQKELESADKLIEIALSKKNIRTNASPKARFLESQNEIDKFLKKTDDKTVHRYIDAYRTIYGSAECSKRSNVQSTRGDTRSNEFRRNRRKRGRGLKYKCHDKLGRELNDKYFTRIKEDLLTQKFKPMLDLASKYPMLSRPESLFSIFTESKTIAKSSLMGKIIGDMGFYQSNPRSKALLKQKNDMIMSLTQSDKAKFDSLTSSKAYQDNITKLLGDSSYAAIFNRVDDRYLRDGDDDSYMKPANQNYIDKLDSSILNFCEDNDLDFDYHNHKGLAEIILNNPSLIDEKKELTVEEATISSQIAYCHLLETEPPSKGGISSASIMGFGLLAAGGVTALLPVPGARVVAAASFTAAGGLLTAVGIADTIESGSLQDQEEGYLAIGVSDILKLHNLETSHNTNKALVLLDAGLLVLDVGLIRSLYKANKAISSSSADSNLLIKENVPVEKNGQTTIFSDFPEAIAVRNKSLSKKDLDELGDSNKLSMFTFDAFHEGHYLPEIVKAVVKANERQMKVINDSIETALKGASDSKIEEIDMFVEYALTQPNKDAILLLSKTNELLDKIDKNVSLIGREKQAKNAMKRFKKIKDENINKVHVTSKSSFDEQSEWLKCKSAKYSAKRAAGYDKFLASVPGIEMAVIPTSAVISNSLKFEEAQWGTSFFKMVISEMVFIQLFARHSLKYILSPALRASNNIPNRALSVGAQAVSFFGSGLFNGAFKGLMLEQIEKLPIDKKEIAYKMYYSSEFQTQLDSIEKSLIELEKLPPEQRANLLGFDSESEMNEFRKEAEKVLETAPINFVATSNENQNLAAKMAIADASFGFANAFKVVGVSQLLSPYFCMANSNILSEEVRKKYQKIGTRTYFAQSVATSTGYFQYRDWVLSD